MHPSWPWQPAFPRSVRHAWSVNSKPRGFLDRHADQIELVRVEDLLEEWQAAERRAFKEIPCRWVIPGHGRKQLESALEGYSARQIHQQPAENYGERSSPRVCLGLFAAAEALG